MTVNQPSALPTNKLSASLVGLVIGAILFEILAAAVPSLRDVQIEGVGSLSIVCQVLVSGGLGYLIPDRPNVALPPPGPGL